MGERQPGAAVLRDDGAPRWEAVTFEVECSRCGYNLRSLVEPRCPECGLAFSWARVLDQAAHHSKFLFEHNWRTRPVRSLIKTVWLSLRPRAFWSRVSIHERPEARVLWAFVLASPVVFVVTLVAGAWCVATLLELTESLWLPAGWNRMYPPVVVSPVREAITELLIRYQWTLREFVFQIELERELFLLLGFALVVLTAMGVVRMLWQTLGRYRIRGVQVLRVVAYAAVPAAIATAVACLVALLLTDYINEISVWANRRYDWVPYLTNASLWFCSVTLPLVFYLAAGLKHYLRLPNARGVGMAAALIGVMFTLVLIGIVIVVIDAIWV